MPRLDRVTRTCWRLKGRPIDLAGAGQWLPARRCTTARPSGTACTDTVAPDDDAPIGGQAMLKAVASPVPAARFCPTGGVTADTAADYLALPNAGAWAGRG